MNLSALFRRASVLLTCWLLVALSLSTAHAFDEDHKERINGTLLHFRVRGTDKSHPYLLILHGGPGFSSHMFYPWGTALEKTVNIVYLDQRGSGESERLTVANPYAPTKAELKTYTISALVDDIEGVRQFLQIDRWYVLGHSWGGMLGLEYVSHHPTVVIGYIHMDGLLSVPLTQDSILKNAEVHFKVDLAHGDTSTKDAARNGLQTIKKLRPLPYDNPKRLEGAYALALGPAGLYFAKDPQTAFFRMNRQIADAVKPYSIPMASLYPAGAPGAAMIFNEHYLTRDDRPLLAKITVPTLVMNGKQDGVITPESAALVQKGIPGSTLVLLDQCGHFPFLEQPDATTKAIQQFVTRPSVP